MAVADIITHVRRLVQDEPFQDQLSASYTAAALTVSVDNPTAWEFGDIMDFPEVNASGSYEQMRVFEQNITANSIDVQIGHNNTTNQNHADNAIVLKNPRYGTDQITKAITHVVDTWLWPDLFVVTSTSITPTPTTSRIYDAPSDFLDVISYRRGLVQAATGSIEDLVYSTYEIVDTVPTTISASNRAVRVTHWQRIDVAATFFYKAKMTTTNMTSADEPIIAYGVASQLLADEIQEKSDRFDEDDRTGRMLRNLRDERLRQYKEKVRRRRQHLLKQWGPPERTFRHARA